MWTDNKIKLSVGAIASLYQVIEGAEVKFSDCPRATE
jgi:hypothetical protein